MRITGFEPRMNTDVVPAAVCETQLSSYHRVNFLISGRMDESLTNFSQIPRVARPELCTSRESP